MLSSRIQRLCPLKGPLNRKNWFHRSNQNNRFLSKTRAHTPLPQTHTHIHTCTSTHTRTHARAHTHTYMYTYTHKHTHATQSFGNNTVVSLITACVRELYKFISFCELHLLSLENTNSYQILLFVFNFHNNLLPKSLLNTFALDIQKIRIFTLTILDPRPTIEANTLGEQSYVAW